MGLGVAITFLGTCTHVILRHVDATLSYRWGGVGWGGGVKNVPWHLHSRDAT